MHCPQCGARRPEGAEVCPLCGDLPSAGAGAPAADAREARPSAAVQTIIGIASVDHADNQSLAALRSRSRRDDHGAPAKVDVAPGPAQPASPAAARTLVGLPSGDLASRLAEVAGPAADRARPLGETRVVGTPAAMVTPGAPRPQGDGRLAGVPALPEQRPAQRQAAPPRSSSAHELGATMGPQQVFRSAPRAPAPYGVRARRMHRIDVAPARAAGRSKPKPSRWVQASAIAGGIIATAAVLCVLLWPDAPPITARTRTDPAGREVLQLRCETCPDGTVVHVGEGSASTTGGLAEILLPAPLSVGENRMSVRIDRPDDGRDEVVSVVASVAYRIRPDLTTLQGERPSIQVLVEAMRGTEVMIDGKALPLVSGHAALPVDVAEAITGFADEPTTLNRQIPYVVRPPNGAREQGVVSVSIGIVPLRIDAPGSIVVIDTESFVLEGRTARGASIFAGPHPIPVRADGTFAHVMNVSAVGATQFEVRAKMEGMAPRIAKIAVRRVDRLEVAARDFAALGPIGWREIATGAKDQVGKPIVVAGEVIEAHEQGHATVSLLRVNAASGCTDATGCRLRLRHGVQRAVQRGDMLTAYGRVAPAPPSDDHDGTEAAGGVAIPEVQVEFAIKTAPP